MAMKGRSIGPVGPPDQDREDWSEEDKREVRLVLMSDQLSEMAYRVVDWARVAALGRAIVALAEQGRPRQVQ